MGPDGRPINTQWTPLGPFSTSPMQPPIFPKPPVKPIILRQRLELITAAPTAVSKFNGKAGVEAGPSHGGHPVGAAGKTGKLNSGNHQVGKGIT